MGLHMPFELAFMTKNDTTLGARVIHTYLQVLYIVLLLGKPQPANFAQQHDLQVLHNITNWLVKWYTHLAQHDVSYTSK
jgi:hypothetical protein